MAQQSKIGTHATTISRTDGKTIVTYHKTPVVTVDPDGTVTLNSGGWRSATTKTRINQAARQFNLRFSVHQRDFQWFVSVDPVAFGSPMIFDLSIPYSSKYRTRTLPFSDGMRFHIDQTRRTA
jgi:hypothetical protein